MEKKISILKKEGVAIEKFTKNDFKEFFKVEYLSHSTFFSYKKIKNNCPYILRTFLADENKEFFLKYQFEIESGFINDIFIKWIDDELQYGVFANKDIHEKEFIAEYTGFIRKLNRKKPDHNPYCFHYPTKWWSLNYIVIDALKEGNESRFINHSDNPNLIPICAIDNDNILHILFIANRKIKKGEQLFFNYGKDFWIKREKIDAE